jgi:hypothetical protein
VAHEAPTPHVLPEPERRQMRQRQRQRDVEDTFARDGPLAAMQALAALAGLDFADREPGVEFPRPSAQHAASMQFFFTHDAHAAHRYDLEVRPTASCAKNRLVGRTSCDRWPQERGHRDSQALSGLSAAFLDLGALQPAATRIVVGAGSSNRGQSGYRGAEALATTLGCRSSSSRAATIPGSSAPRRAGRLNERRNPAW